MSNSVTCTVVRMVAAHAPRLFDEVVAEDVLPKVLPAFGPIPGVARTRGHTGPWDTPGSRREIVFTDRSTVREEVTEWIRPARFAYRVDEFTNILGRLVTHADGDWGFWSQAGGSGFVWTYTFHARHRIAVPALRLFVALAWRPYMNRAADRCARLATNAPGGQHGD